MPRLPSTVLLSILALAPACGNPGGGPSGGPGATAISVVLRSSTLVGAAPSTRALRPQGGDAGAASSDVRHCRLSLNGPDGVDGFCTTPLRVRGTANQISVSGPTHVPTRLLGGGQQGVEGLFSYHPFELDTSATLAGEDNVGEVETQFDELKVHWNHVETSFEAAGRVFTLRHVVFSQPIFDEPAFDSCIRNPGERERIEKAGQLFPGVTAKRGDVLVCIKNDKAERCTDGEFSWVDATTGALTKVRPDKPARLAGEFFTTKPRCTPAPETRDTGFTAPVFELRVKLAAPFWLAAKNTTDHRVYRFRDGAGTRSGSKLTLAFDFDLQSSLFWEIDPATATEAEILSGIDRVMLVPLRVANGRTQDGDGAAQQGMTVKVSAALE
jgi:hypothetical protein